MGMLMVPRLLKDLSIWVAVSAEEGVIACQSGIKESTGGWE